MPESIPDFLALVGDSADGYPGVPRWGAKSSARVLFRYGHLEAIPKDAAQWDLDVRGAAGLTAVLGDHWDEALLFRDLATLRTDADLFNDVDELRWKGPGPELEAVCEELGARDLKNQLDRLMST